jgi:hypothetical protein
LSWLLNYGLLGNKTQFSSHDVFFFILHVNYARVKLFLFLPLTVVLQNALILFIVMFGVLYQLFLILITSTLWYLLMIIVDLLGCISFIPNLRSFLFSSHFFFLYWDSIFYWY